VKYAARLWTGRRGNKYSVTFMCDQLGVTRQGPLSVPGGPCARERTDAELTEAILEIHTELDGNPGVRWVWAGHLSSVSTGPGR
jgi:hypothetical protein